MAKEKNNNSKIRQFALFIVVLILSSGCQLVEPSSENEHEMTFQENIEINFKQKNVNTCSYVKNVDGTNIKPSAVNRKKQKIYVSNYEVSCGEVSTKKLGKTTITYKIREQKITVKAVVKDLECPKLVLKQSSIEVLEGTEVKFLEYIDYSDNVDAKGVLKPKVDGHFDKNKVGTQDIKITVSDSSKNTSSVMLRVMVKAKPKQTENQKENLQQNNAPNNDQNSNSSGTTNNHSNPAPYSEYFLFADGYNMATAPNTCQQKLNEAYSRGRNATCTDVTDKNGNPLGQVLKVE